MKLFVSSSLFLASTFSYGIVDFTKNASQDSTHISGLIGTFSNKLTDVIDSLIVAPEIIETNSPDIALYKGQNRAILYGPPGNGKTTIAKKIAEATGSIFIELSGPTIVDKFIGEGGRKISEAFDEARNTVASFNGTAVIFIDEIDAIASTIKDEGTKAEALRITQALWKQLDSIKDDPRILVIGATNNFKDLDKTFIDRFGANVIEIKNPAEPMRFDVLTFYCTTYSKNRPCDESALSFIAKQSNGLSVRALEDLIISAARDAKKRGLEKIDTNYLLNDLTIIKAKMLGSWQDRLKDYASSLSSTMQKHAYPHIQALFIVGGTLYGLFKATHGNT